MEGMYEEVRAEPKEVKVWINKKRVILKESTKVLDRIRMYKIYLMCSFF